MTKQTHFFETHIFKLFRTINKDLEMTLNVKQQLNSIICSLAKIISKKSFELTFFSKKKTISEKEIRNSIKLIMYENFFQEVDSYCNTALERYHTKEDTKDKRISRQNKANIIFPPSVSEKFLRNFGYNKLMLTTEAPIYLASVLEYIMKIILQNTIRKLLLKVNHKRIVIRDIELVIQNNENLKHIFSTCNITLTGGGVVPKIHELLLLKRTRKRVKNDKQFTDRNQRFKPGTVSLRNIKKYQKASNCLSFAKLPFENLVRDIVQKYEDVKFSKDIFPILQHYIESYIVNLFKQSNMLAVYCKRIKILPEDIRLVCKIKNEIL